MVTESDRIRADIDMTRGALADDVSTLADRTNPKKMAQRRWDSVKGRTRSARERVMGASSQAAGVVSDKASSAADTARQAAKMVAPQAQGSPIGAGLIAFGVGLVTAALLPETDPERRLGSQLAEHGAEVTGSVGALAKDIGSEVKESAREAVSTVGETAKEAAGRTTEQAKQSGQDVANEVRG